LRFWRVEARAFGSQFDAHQPLGNGISGQAASLSLAALGGTSFAGSTIGGGGDATVARRKRAHVKFMSINPATGLSLKIQFQVEIVTRSQNGALISNSSSILEKTKPRFNGGAACTGQVRLIG
jgi:hypothetical protein